MAVTQNTYTGNGSTVLFSFTFPYLETTDIKVTLDGTLTTEYTLANATTIQFNTAPANGTEIRIYRVTDDSGLSAEFFPGSAIRAQDLNDNFTQNLYVTQESNRDATAATDTANSATATANTALTNSQTAIATANTADANATAAVATANTADANASAAVSTANTASTNASAAVSTANSAATDAATAITTADGAVVTANSAATDAATAITTANAAVTTANAAVTTANTAAADATVAVSTANTADTNASTAVTTANTASSTANTALSTANAAASAVANAILYDLVANVAAIPGSPANNDAVEVVDSTGIESFTPISGVPTGFVGDSGLSVRLVYTTTGSTWNWIQYFPNDPETRYGDSITTLQTDLTAAEGDITTLQGDVLGLDNSKLALAGGTMTGALTLAADPTTNLQAATKQYVDNNLPPGTTVSATAPSTPGAGDLWYDSVGGRLYVWYDDGDSSQWVDASPQGNRIAEFSTGSAAAPGLYVEGDPNTGIYSPGADQLALSTNGTGRLFVDASGRVGVGAAPVAGAPFQVQAAKATIGLTSTTGTNSAYATFINTGANFYVGIDSSTSEFAAPYAGVMWQGGAYPLIFATGNTERARIDSSGNLLVGRTETNNAGSGLWLYNDTNGGRINLFKTGDGLYDSIANYHNGSYVGGLTYSNTATALVTSSDIRLKTNIRDSVNATDIVEQIRVVSHDWVHDDSSVRFGFIAQELNDILPEAVRVGDSGEEIGQTWGVDYARLVPVLTKALQEAVARIETLEAQNADILTRLTALEGGTI